MRLTIEETRILQDLSERVTSPVPRGPKPADYAERQELRRAEWRKVGDLINRYELWLEQN
jgi:hypothetical protein